MPDRLFCSQCGTQNTPGAVFCQRCGAGLQPRADITAAASPGAVYAAPTSAYGGFWIRFLAVVIDGIIVRVVTIPFAALLGAFGILHHPNVFRGRMDESDVIALVAASATLVPIILGISWLYEALLTSSTWQGTVGKKLLNLKVIDEAGNRISFLRATGRHFAKYYVSSILLIGFIMAAFTDRKRALHDFIAGTLVKKG
jgi:uncharacterized RDD family membrane protein YckC